MVDPAPAVIVLGLKVAVTPGSEVKAESAMVPAIPIAVVLSEMVGIGLPRIMLIVVGLAEIAKSLARPSPCSGTDWDPPGTLPVNVRLPKRSPTKVGENVTNIKHVEPAANGSGELGQSVNETAKSPEIDMVVTSGPVPELRRMTWAAALVIPTLTDPKSMLDVSRLAAGVPGGVTMPVPSTHVSFAYVLGETPALKPPNKTMRPSTES